MSTSGINVDELPLKEGAIEGATVWIGGVIVMVVLAMLAYSGAGALSGGILFWYVLNLLPLLIVVGGDPNAMILAMTAIPVLVLVYGGYRAAARSPNGGFVAGACIAVGYLPLVLLSYLIASGSSTGFGVVFSLVFDVLLQGSYLFVSLAFMGIVMPVVFGGLGGMLASR